GGPRLDDGRNGEWRPVSAPAASLGLGTLRPDSLSSVANTVGVGIRRAVHPCLLRFRRSLSRGRIGAGGYRKRDAREHERAEDGFRALRKHCRSSFLLNHVKIVEISKLHMIRIASHDSHFQFCRTSAHRMLQTLSQVT